MFRVIMSILILIAVTCMIIAGMMLGQLVCGIVDNANNYIPEGNIVSMEFQKAHLQLCGKTLIYIQDRYIITITDGNKQYTTEIPKDDFKRLKVNDYYIIDK